MRTEKTIEYKVINKRVYTYYCDRCKEEITKNRIEIETEVDFIEEVNTDEYDFCSFDCLAKFLRSFEWEDWFDEFSFKFSTEEESFFNEFKERIRNVR